MEKKKKYKKRRAILKILINNLIKIYLYYERNS